MRRNFTDFIEKQRAAFGKLEAAEFAAMRARERAALVAEQFAFEQMLGIRGAIHDDERLILPVAVRVNRLRDQLFARAAFAVNQDS